MAASISHSSSESSRPKRKHDALTEASPTPHPEGPKEAHARTHIDTPKSERIKLSARGLELLTALSGRRMCITDIKFSNNSPQDGGTFADIVVATLVMTSRAEQGEKRVAVKKLRVFGDMTEEKLFLAFVNELRLLDGLSHPNIVEIVGFVEDMENRVAWLIFPWEENGNLRQFLRSATWELPERVWLIRDVALGLEYLHTRQRPICHGDLKSLNILVNSSNRAVITDFGSAHHTEVGSTSVSNPGVSSCHPPSKPNDPPGFKVNVSNNTLTLTSQACTVQWAPPEYFTQGRLDLASDIWALGWIAWEAITDQHPFEELDSEAHVMMRVLEGRLPLIYEHHQLSAIGLICSMMEKCWKQDAVKRPSATECLNAFNLMPLAIPTLGRGDNPNTRSAELLMEIGEIHRLKGRDEEASRMFEQGLAVARSIGDQETVAHLLILLADNSRDHNRIVEAERSYTEALAISQSIGYDHGLVDALNGLGEVQIEKSDIVSAATSFAEALAVSRSINYGSSQARALIGLGDVQYHLSKYAEAEASYTEALEICMSMGLDHVQTSALNGLGDVRRAQRKYIEAEASYDEALVICKSIGYDYGRAEALKGLGDVRRDQHKYIEAEASYAEALVICKSIGYDMGRANALNGLGDVRRAQRKYIEAEASYTEALATCKSIGYDQGRANALNGLGDVRRDQRKYIEAEAPYAEALVICKSIGYDMGRANALNGLGDVRLAQRKYIEAEGPYAEALAIYKNIGDDQGRVKSCLGLAEIRLHQARYAEAKRLVEDVIPISERLDYEWGMDTSKELLDKILKAGGSFHNPLVSTLPASTPAEDAYAASPTPLPVADESSASLL